MSKETTKTKDLILTAVIHGEGRRTLVCGSCERIVPIERREVGIVFCSDCLILPVEEKAA